MSRPLIDLTCEPRHTHRILVRQGDDDAWAAYFTTIGDAGRAKQWLLDRDDEVWAVYGPYRLS